MTIYRQTRFLNLAVPLLGLAVPSSVFGQNATQATPLTSASEPSVALSAAIKPAATDLQLDNLISRLGDKRSLLRVQTLQAIDASPGIDSETVNRALQDALDDKDPLVREAALRAFLHRSDEQLLSIRESDLSKCSGETAELVRVRLAVYNRNTSALRDLMRNGDAVVQESAFEALASNDADAAVELLKDEFLDTNSLYRLQTLELLARSPYTNSSATLTPILDIAVRDADPLVRSRAKQLLNEKKAESVTQTEDGAK